MVSLRGTLANLGLRYEIDLVKQQGGPMPELSSSGQRLIKKERNTKSRGGSWQYKSKRHLRPCAGAATCLRIGTKAEKAAQK